MNWPEDRSRLIADAFELRGKQGVALLSRMGSFDLWRGSLARMRGDSSTEVVADPSDATNPERFLQALSVSRAFDVIPKTFAEAVRLAYFEGGSVQQVAKEFGMPIQEAADLVEYGTKRLFEVASVKYRTLVASFEEEDDFETAGHPAIPLSERADVDGSPAERK